MRFAAHMRNLGPNSAAWLAEAGIVLAEDLVTVGPIEAYLKVKSVCGELPLDALWVFYGAIHDLGWDEVSVATKRKLEEELRDVGAVAIPRSG